MKDSNLLGAVLIAGAIVLFGLCQRYDVVDVGGHRLVKLDRLTGQAEPCMIMPDDESAARPRARGCSSCRVVLIVIPNATPTRRGRLIV